MDKRVKNICQDIQNGKLPEENIPKLFNYLADYNQVWAEVRLAMHYYTLYESYYDEEGTWSEDVLTVVSNINKLIKDNVVKNQSGLVREKAVEEADSVRQDLMKHMNALTAYTDIFQNYEYVLNRIEYRFRTEAAAFDEEEFSKDILRYIFDSEDNVIINEKIKEIIGQLPIRITKQKYFELLRESLGAYLGAEVSSFDSCLYMLRTSAMLYQEDGMETLYPKLWEKKEYLAHLDYQNITAGEYQKAKTVLNSATLILETETTVYIALQEIINEVYAILLCSAYSGMSAALAKDAEKAAGVIILRINEKFIKKEKEDILEELMDQFKALEGVQEELSFETGVMENALDEVVQNHNSLVESLMLGQFLQVLLRSGDLLSDSLYIDWQLKKDTAPVDAERWEKEIVAFTDELTKLFETHDRMVSRAVMAGTISKIPVFFNSHKEVMDYVRYSFERCTDLYEKAACREIIKDMIKA